MRIRGYALPLVIIVLGTLGSAMTVMVFVLSASAKTTSAMLGRRETLYACDGIVRGLTVKSRDYFATTAVPTAAGLRDHLCGVGTAPLCPPIDSWTPDFVIEEVDAVTGAVDVVEEVPTGPFRGQMARRTDIDLTVAARKASVTQRCRVTQTAVNSQIGLFQFAVFSSIYMDLFNPPPMKINGRVHINGDFCAGGSDLTIEKLTASGRILTSGCPALNDSGAGFFIVDANNPTNAPAIAPANDGNESNWRTTSLATWHGNAQDKSHNVPVLRLPVATSTATQLGTNASGATLSNANTLRLMIDPPDGSDGPDAAAERLANKADIRIINGVWYKRTGTTFPGTPIWSDHPAAYSPVTEEVSVVGTQAYPLSNAGPKRYSYYETNGSDVVVNDPAPSVVSYGALLNTTTLGKPSGAGIAAATTDEDRLNGTRTGFVDRRMELGLSGSDQERAKILPLNFDVGAFVDALANGTNPGELGAVFPPGTFNGIVWIANTWQGFNNGFSPAGLAGLPERKGSGAALASVPLPLCGGSGILAGAVAKAACSSSLALPSAVRVWNAEQIDSTVLPGGLTIATNGPIYTLGDFNTGSLVGGVPTAAPQQPSHKESGASSWVPMLVAGDALTVQSNAWSDNTKPWSAAPLSANSCSGSDNALTTTLVTAVLAGHVQTSTTKAGGGINNFPRFIECWSGVPLRIHGSLVIGFRSVYQRQPFVNPSSVYFPPQRFWDFDPNLAKPANQPPGTPSFFVQAVERWQRD